MTALFGSNELSPGIGWYHIDGFKFLVWASNHWIESVLWSSCKMELIWTNILLNDIQYTKAVSLLTIFIVSIGPIAKERVEWNSYLQIIDLINSFTAIIAPLEIRFNKTLAPLTHILFFPVNNQRLCEISNMAVF